MADLQLSVLDQAPILAGADAPHAIAETLALAAQCEQLGYHRYWVAEHHNTRAFASAAPEVLLARLSAQTRTIRIGSGGVMLPYYSPYKVAEQFRLLEVLAPGRVDLGVGRAPGGSPKVQAAMRAGPAAWPLEVFPQQVILLRQFLEDARGAEGAAGGFAPAHPYRGVRAQPLGAGEPALWMLGSAQDGAVLAGQMGLPYCFAHFIQADGLERAVELYRGQFRPSPQCERPRLAIAVSALAAENAAAAEAHGRVRDYWAVRFLQGRPGAFPSPAEARAWQPDAEERSLLAHLRARHFAGSGEEVVAALGALQKAHDAQELFLVTIADSYAARLASYEQIARFAGLRSRCAQDKDRRRAAIGAG